MQNALNKCASSKYSSNIISNKKHNSTGKVFLAILKPQGFPHQLLISKRYDVLNISSSSSTAEQIQ